MAALGGVTGGRGETRFAQETQLLIQSLSEQGADPGHCLGWVTKPPPSSSATRAVVFWVGGLGRQGLKDLCALSLAVALAAVRGGESGSGSPIIL